MIWNDSYSFVKNTRIKSQNYSDFVEYDSVIKRIPVRINERESIKKGLMDDFRKE